MLKMENCTIYCKMQIDEIEAVCTRLSILNPQKVEVSEGKVECTVESGVVRISRMVFEQRADRFSKLCADTMNYFRSKGDSNESGVVRVLAHLEDTNAILGVVADPSFDGIAMLPELIGFLAFEFQGMIFNGAEMLDRNGEVIA